MIKIKDTLKLYGVILLTFGSVFVSTIFLNYYLDLKTVPVPGNPIIKIIYEGQLIMSKVTVSCTGGVLGFITLIVLLFTIEHFINKNQANMGILKALGYKETEISLPFLKYGFPVFVGTLSGYVMGMLSAKTVYGGMSEYESINPAVSFQWITLFILVILPSVLFSLTAFLFAYGKLQKDPLAMIKGMKAVKIAKRTARLQEKSSGMSFLKGFKRIMRMNHPILSLFVGIAAWGFSAMVQMSFTMMSIEMSDMAPAIVAPIGIMMGFVTLLISADFVISVNRQNISMMKAYGYTEGECYSALLNGYRPVAWIGFAVGTCYQYFFMKIMVELFAGAYDVEVSFNLYGFLITFFAFVLYYEGVMLYYKRKIEKIPLKEAMTE